MDYCDGFLSSLRNLMLKKQMCAHIVSACRRGGYYVRRTLAYLYYHNVCHAVEWEVESGKWKVESKFRTLPNFQLSTFDSPLLAVLAGYG